MRRLLGSDAGMVESKYEMLPFTDSFALLSAALGVVFATMGCVSLRTLTLFLFRKIMCDTHVFKAVTPLLFFAFPFPPPPQPPFLPLPPMRDANRESSVAPLLPVPAPPSRRQKHHKHLVYGITMTSGVFGGLLFCNLVFPPAITDEAKIVCALVIGFGLWYLALHGEKVVLQIFGVSAGMATGTFVFNIVAEFYVINAHFLILALAVVSILVAPSRGFLLFSPPVLFVSPCF